MDRLVYKIAPRALWEAAEMTGVFAGASIDFEDGYIHLSSGAQVRETAEAGRAIIRALAGLAEFRNDDSSVNPDRVRGFRRILSEGISDLLSLEPRPRPDELK